MSISCDQLSLSQARVYVELNEQAAFGAAFLFAALQ